MCRNNRRRIRQETKRLEEYDELLGAYFDALRASSRRILRNAQEAIEAVLNESIAQTERLMDEAGKNKSMAILLAKREALVNDALAAIECSEESEETSS